MEKMKVIIQRVATASVEIDGIIFNSINQGLLVFIGIHKNDSEALAEWFIRKICSLRIFNDENQKMNLSLQDIGGELLIVSQFTLYANAEKGLRPSFVDSAPPEIAQPLYDYFVENSKKIYSSEKVKTGVFGATMKIHLCNEGPVTIDLQKDL